MELLTEPISTRQTEAVGSGRLQILQLPNYPRLQSKHSTLRFRRFTGIDTDLQNWNTEVTLSWQLWADFWLERWPYFVFWSLYSAYIYRINRLNAHLASVAKPHRRGVIEVDRNTINWTNGEQTVLALWEDVQSVSYEPGPRWREHYGVLTLKATTGSFQMVPAAIGGGDELENIIRMHAPAAALVDYPVASKDSARWYLPEPAKRNPCATKS